MIITKTPLRIGLVGGGSDLPSFHKTNKGACINVTINKYVYVLVKKRFDKKIYLKYSENEVVESVDEIKHDFIRETLKFLNIDFGVEVINWADIPTKGTGLGSSSSFLVGLLLALHTLMGNKVTKKQIAEEACEIEINRCGKNIGYQDQFAASYGGLNYMTFCGDVSKTQVFPIPIEDQKLVELSDNFMAFFTGFTRESNTILTEQSKTLVDDQEKIEMMKENVHLAENLYYEMIQGCFTTIGFKMDENWRLKKHFNNSISNCFIDNMYSKSKWMGADGGKITGAGGGGFLIIVSEKEHQNKIKNFLTNYASGIEHMPIKFDPYGSRVLINVEEYTWG